MKPNKLLLMGFIHLLIMFALMYVLVFQASHIYLNVNKFYMAGIMTAPMLILEIVLMGSMYENRRILNIILLTSTIFFILLFYFLRNQTTINNQAFLRSMIPHHSSAILMCERANITDPEIEDLCTEIVETQKEEINIMQQKLDELTKL